MYEFGVVSESALLFGQIHVVLDRLEVVVKRSWILVVSLAGGVVAYGDVGFREPATPDKFEGPVFELLPGRRNGAEGGSLIISPLGTVVWLYAEKPCSDAILVGGVSLGARVKNIA